PPARRSTQDQDRLPRRHSDHRRRASPEAREERSPALSGGTLPRQTELPSEPALGFRALAKDLIGARGRNQPVDRGDRAALQSRLGDVGDRFEINATERKSISDVLGL